MIEKAAMGFLIACGVLATFFCEQLFAQPAQIIIEGNVLNGGGAKVKITVTEFRGFSVPAGGFLGKQTIDTKLDEYGTYKITLERETKLPLGISYESIDGSFVLPPIELLSSSHPHKIVRVVSSEYKTARIKPTNAPGIAIAAERTLLLMDNTKFKNGPPEWSTIVAKRLYDSFQHSWKEIDGSSIERFGNKVLDLDEKTPAASSPGPGTVAVFSAATTPKQSKLLLYQGENPEVFLKNPKYSLLIPVKESQDQLLTNVKVTFSGSNNLLAHGPNWKGLWRLDLPKIAKEGMTDQKLLLKSFPSYFRLLAGADDGKTIASLAPDGSLHLMEAVQDPVRTLTKIPPGINKIRAAAFLGKKLLVGGTTNGELHLWEVESGKRLETVKLPGNFVRSIETFPDNNNRFVVGTGIGSQEGSVSIYRLEGTKLQLEKVQKFEKFGVQRVQVSQDAKKVLLALQNGEKIAELDVKTGQVSAPSSIDKNSKAIYYGKDNDLLTTDPWGFLKEQKKRW